MSNFWGSVVASALAGMGGTGLGAVIAVLAIGLFRRKIKIDRLDNVIKIAMSFSGGLMLSIIFFDLMPESFKYTSITGGLTSMIAGCATIPLFELTARIMHLPFAEEDAPKSGKAGDSGYLKAGILVTLGIALHNFPEGLAIGSGFVGNFGVVLAIIIALHDIPEGIAMAVPLVAGEKKPFSVIIASVIAGLPTVIGGAVGWFFAGLSEKLIGVCLGYAGGAMLYVVMGQLLPICYKDKGPKGIVTSVIIGLIAGLLIINMF